MGKTIRAKFSKGCIMPLENVKMYEGKEFSVTIMEIPTKSNKDVFEKSAGSWKGTIDAEKLIKDIYADRLISIREIPKL